jgi:hypothetical protein
MTKIASTSLSIPAQLRVVEWGDSVAAFHAGPVVTKLQGELGNAGFILGGTINSSSGTVLASSSDFISTPTGTYENLSSGGCVVYGNGGGYVSATKLSLLYIKEPGAGTLTLSTNLNGAGFVTGPSVNASNGSRVGGVLSTTTSNGVTGPWTIQACATGGPVKVYGPGFENLAVNGVITVPMNFGGIALSDMNFPSTAITAPWFAAINPDLVTFEMKENGALNPVVTTRLQDLNTFVANWQTANPLADFLLIGTSPSLLNNPIQIADNQTLASVAQANNQVFWDGYSPSLNYATEVALGWITDTSSPHQTALGQKAESNLLWSQLGFGALLDATSTNNVSNAAIQTTQLTVQGPFSGTGDTAALTFSSISNTGTQASIQSSWWNSGVMTFTAPRDLAGGSGFVFKSNGGTTRLYIDSVSGNVGIGTTTPWKQLSVGANNTGTFAISTSTAGCAQFSALGEVYSTGTACGSGSGGSFGKTFEINGSGASAYLAPTTTIGIIISAASTIGNGTQVGGLTTNGGATTTSNAYFASNVYIGTPAPISSGYGLNILGNPSGNNVGANFENSNAAGYSGVALFDNNNTLAASFQYGNSGTVFPSTFFFGNRGTGPTDIVAGAGAGVIATFLNNGNFGVGTTSPFATLSVAGGAFITGGATTSALAITGIPSSLLKTLANGTVVAAVPGTDYANFGYEFPGNATTTGLGIFGSTTIGNGAQAGGLTISGGATTTGFINTLGTTGGFRIDNKLVLQASSTNSSLTVGFSAAPLLKNVAIGDTAVGNSALALFKDSNLSGSGFTTAVGYQALSSLLEAVNSTALGAQAAAAALGNPSATNPGDLTAIGALSSGKNTDGQFTVAVGDSAALGNPNPYAAERYTVVGSSAGFNFLTGANDNALFGYQAGYNISTGAQNTILGGDAATPINVLTTGINNILIGYAISATSSSANNSLNIGNSIYGSGIATGTAISKTVKIGIGSSTPFAEFAIHAGFGGTSQTLFAIGSSTANSTSTLFSISNTGNVTSIVGNNADNVFSISTSTANAPIFSISTRSSPVGMVGIGSSSPWGKLSVEMGSLNPAFVVSNQGSSSPAFFVSGVNQNGNVGIGTSSPFAKLSIFASFGEYNPVLFAIGSSSISGTSTLFQVMSNGRVDIGSSTPSLGNLLITAGSAYLGSSISSVLTFDAGAINLPRTATTTVVNGLDNVFSIATSSSNTPIFSISTKNSPVGRVGIGTSSPWGKLSVEMGTLNPAFVISNQGSSTVALYVGGVNQNGFVGIGTTTNILATTSVLAVGNSSIASGNTIAVFSNAAGAAYISNLGLSVSSDSRLKKNITSLPSALNGVLSLQAVSYNFNSETDVSAPHIGFIAQQVQPLFPDLVQINGQGYLSVNYGGLTPYLVSAVQSQQQEILAIASSTATTTQIFISNQNVFLGFASTTATSTPALAVWNATATTSASVVVNGMFYVNGQNIGGAVASSSATTTTDALVNGSFSSVSTALKTALADAFSALGSLTEGGVRELGVAMHATVGVFDKVFAREVHTDKLCVGNTCVTQEQFVAMVAASQGGSGSVGGSGGSGGSDTTTPPTITINGNNPATIHVGDTYNDLGATVKDNAGHDLTVHTYVNGSLLEPVTLNTSSAVTDTIDYVATDTWGNTSTSTRQVLVQ